MRKPLPYLLSPLRHLTLRQVILILIPALSLVCWVILLLLIYQQFAAVGLERYVRAQDRLISTFVKANTTSLKLHDYAEIQRNMASLEFGSGKPITAVIDRSGEYILGKLDNPGADFTIINDWMRANDIRSNVQGRTFNHGGTGYFVFQRPILDPDDSVYLGTLISFVDDTAFRKQVGSTRKTLLIVGIALLAIQIAIILIIVGAIVAPIEAFAKKAAEHTDIAELSKDLSSMGGMYTKDIAVLGESLAAAMARHAVEITLGRLSSQLAHDMRSPLSVLMAFAKAEEHGDIDARDKAEYRTAALRSVNRLNDMANDLLDYSRSRDAVKKPADVADVIRNVIADSRIAVTDKTIELSYSGPENLTASIDEAKIVRVITNIVANAIQAIPERGSIVVSAGMDAQNTLTISIRDTGTGIKPEHLPKIFDQTFTFGKKGGIGLGLAYCHNVVKAHGGRIDVTSEVGKGTEFRIILPSS